MYGLEFTPEQQLSVWSWSGVSSVTPTSSSWTSRAFGDRTGRYKLFIGQFKWALVDVKREEVLGKGTFEKAQFRAKELSSNGANISFDVDGGEIGIYQSGGGIFTFSEGQKTLARQMDITGRVETEVRPDDFVIPSQDSVLIETVFLGGIGLPLSTYQKTTLMVYPKGFSISQAAGTIWTKSFEDLVGIQITGEGLYQTGGGWVGGGFGISGALKGAAFASIMNSLTTRTHNDCYFRFVYLGTDATFQVLSHTPMSLEISLSGIRNWLETKFQEKSLEAGESRISRVDQLEKLHQLFERGVLNEGEYQTEKKRILDGR